ncbi:hypothetical protein DAEQUDRAFT_756796 [Daedalea quercina L-15889]|uniref:BTB domain-containing protein n=1 Tax=Daedalea quercina L-15889 TaxID=1314783 RepID=A0A165QLU0_9APHY|nr:hypothetical protein DAEQUDRAFT_756796 [Daedalea quercina L-15889]
MLPSPHIQRDTEFWFLDGNVVLVASGIGFRVYKGLLARDSRRFADMFSLPQPTGRSSIEVFDGCPVVHLTDFQGDVRMLLRALLGRHCQLLDSTHIDFVTTAALIRLGKKYEMQDPYNSALGVFKTFLSTRYGSWYDQPGPQLAEWQRYGLDPITAVNLARLTDANSVLHIAMYMCCQLNTDHLLRGTVRPDGTYEQLSPDDLRRCLDARVFLAKRKDAASEKVFHLSSPTYGCPNPAFCMVQLTNLWAQYKREFGSSCVEGWTINGPWHAYRWLSLDCYQRYHPLCSNCIAVVETQHRDACSQMWSDLPDYFGLRTVSSTPVTSSTHAQARLLSDTNTPRSSDPEHLPPPAAQVEVHSAYNRSFVEAWLSTQAAVQPEAVNEAAPAESTAAPTTPRDEAIALWNIHLQAAVAQLQMAHVAVGMMGLDSDSEPDSDSRTHSESTSNSDPELELV